MYCNYFQLRPSWIWLELYSDHSSAYRDLTLKLMSTKYSVHVENVIGLSLFPDANCHIIA